MVNPFRIVGLLITLAVLGFAGSQIFGAVDEAKNSVDEANAKGGEESSLFRAGNFSDALDKVKGEIGKDGDILRLTIYPGYVAVEASKGQENEGRAFKLEADGDVKEIPLELVGPGKLADNIFPIARLDAAATGTMIEAAATKMGTDLDGLSHAIAMLDPVSGKPGWFVYADGGSKYLRAELDGSGLADPTAKAKADAEAAVEKATGETGAADAAAGSANDTAACIQAAGTDVTKLQACTK